MKALGRRGKVILDIMIAATQFSFSLSLASYITTASQNVIQSLTGVEISFWIIGLALLFILAPIAWVRNISKFSFTFLIGNLLILTTLVTVTVVLF